MQILVDQSLCDGCGLCVRCASGALVQGADLLAYPVDHDGLSAPPLGTLTGVVPASLRESVLEAVAICPESCISYFDVDPATPPVALDLHDPRRDPLDAFRQRYPGTAFGEVVRVEVDDRLRVWTAAGSYHEVPLA